VVKLLLAERKGRGLLDSALLRYLGRSRGPGKENTRDRSYTCLHRGERKEEGERALHQGFMHFILSYRRKKE